MRTSIKKTIAFALTICAISAGTISPNAGKFTLSQTSIVASAAELNGDFYYELSGNNASIVAYVGNSTYLTLPSQVTIKGKTYKVTTIASNAFKDNTKLYSVKIPSGYTSIGNSAFMYCTNLSNVDTPSTITEIKDFAFYGSGIRSFTVPSGVRTLGESVFTKCPNLIDVSIKTNYITELKYNMFCECAKIRNISIPSSITSIGVDFASGCKSLRAITLPYGLKSIGDSAFKDCTSLDTVSLPSTVTNFGGQVFANTPWIRKQTRTNGFVIKNNNILDASYASGTVTIPSNITKLPSHLFEGNSYITKVIIPSSVNELGVSTFSNCKNLSEVQLSTSITEIPTSCFNKCTSLKSITLPYRISTIGYSAFSECSKLSSINFPDYLYNIKNGAFSNCSSLNNITNVLDYRNYTIADDAFSGCMNLKKINSTTVASRSGYNVYLYKESFVKKYFSNCDTIGFIQDFIDLKCGAVVDQIRNSKQIKKDAQMALELHDWMAKNGASGEEVDYNRKESSILLNGLGVCVGYAYGYNRLLRKAGIEAYPYSGNGHSWNVVKLDGVWFNVDAYWDDKGNYADRKWFLVSDNEMLKYDTSGHHTKTYGTGIIENPLVGGDIAVSERIICDNPIGDVNLDGNLDDKDYQAVVTYINNNGVVNGTFNETCADINFDGDINKKDLEPLWTKTHKN